MIVTPRFFFCKNTSSLWASSNEEQNTNIRAKRIRECSKWKWTYYWYADGGVNKQYHTETVKVSQMVCPYYTHKLGPMHMHLCDSKTHTMQETNELVSCFNAWLINDCQIREITTSNMKEQIWTNSRCCGLLNLDQSRCWDLLNLDQQHK